ncbi:uncharacterized protein B0P05DRAFT_458643, partial [Gilbertella persicaria]|uniref:uncharacterized protein n=1 Tax=Gilbertella persicaria TaxID=101096 RepID=UPI00221F75F3
NAVLNEQDQKTFTSFLDAFSMDKNITLPSIDQQQEEQRRHSILQALDEQKRSYQHKRTPIYLQDTNTRKKKLLLTKEEKRQNHLASEQKRRSNIRHGFKGLIELVPSLQKISNSKSTVLTKAAEFIQHLEKRNTYLTEKLNTLQWRV